MSESTLSAKLLHVIDRIDLKLDADNSVRLLKGIHINLCVLEREQRRLKEEVECLTQATSSLNSSLGELAYPLSFCRCEGQFEEPDLSSDQTGEYTCSCKRCGLKVHEEEEDAVIEMKASDYQALQSRLKSYEEGIPLDDVKDRDHCLIQRYKDVVEWRNSVFYKKHDGFIWFDHFQNKAEYITPYKIFPLPPTENKEQIS